MSCLKDYIGIDGVIPAVTPPSGLFINRELTIPVQHISSVASTSQIDLATVWSEVQDKAIKKFIIRVQLGMQELFNSCDVDEDWVCANIEKLAMPFIYYLGSELMIEIKHTNRINRYTTIDKHRATELKYEFDNEFQVQLKAALTLINAGEKRETGSVYTYVEVLP
ncbi:hypothetical protein [Segetibacter aerophilus]|uniref:Uncharacterized protein n=1 Tax=Segetibacter aerophilus TaxID=670293 RepID=A0A512B9Z0_9BACT|nr:hypothetical protein [Segetibacter aerophilus]GEO08772.1 hypothetical protein SAE01_12680 [Segetibacter aerophilus]